MKKLLILMFFLVSLQVESQESTLDKATWEKLRSEVEFVKSSPNKQKESREGKGSEYSEGNENSTLNLGPFIQILIIILFILFIAALLFTILSNVSLKKADKRIPKETEDALANIEENFTKNNLERWLKHAIEQNDHYLILRIRFLMVLKSLENKKLILWKKDKTNWHYIQELGSHHFQSPFQELVVEFDHVWYGEKKYEQVDLAQKIELFESFQKKIEE